MNNLVLIAFAAVNVVVTAVFAGVVLGQYVRKRRPNQLYWSLALAMAFLATLSYVLMVVVGPASGAGVVLFRLYYILGAALTSAWLGLGSVALVSGPRVTRVCLVILALLSIVAIVFIAIAGVNMGALAHVAGTAGSGVLNLGAGGIASIAVLNTLGVIAVVGVAIYSGWQLVRRQPTIRGLRTSNLLWANILILIGELLNAAAGTFARVLQLESTFWLFMAAGWIVFFIGVLLAGRRSTQLKRAAPTGDQVEVKA